MLETSTNQIEEERNTSLSLPTPTPSPQLEVVEDTTPKRPELGQASASAPLTPSTPPTPTLNISSSSLQIPEGRDLNPWLEKAHLNFTKLGAWVQYLPKKLSAITRMIEEEREAAAVLRIQDKESFLEQIKQLVVGTNTNANSQTSLEQQFKALQEDFKQFRTEHARVVAALHQTINTLRHSPCPACVERTTVRAPIKELPTIDVPDDLDEHEGPRPT